MIFLTLRVLFGVENRLSYEGGWQASLEPSESKEGELEVPNLTKEKVDSIPQ
jgi:hypothetical protein